MEHKKLFDRSVLVSASLKNWASASAIISRKQYQFADLTRDLGITPKGLEAYRVFDVGGVEADVEITVLAIDKHKASLRVDGTILAVTSMSSVKGQLHCSIEGRDALFKDMIILDGMSDVNVGGGRVTAPMHGLLLEVLVEPGDLVVKGQTLAVLEAMKMHYEIQAEIDGTVAEVSAMAGKQVAVDDVLIEIDEQQNTKD